jgi:hypothetical protein
MLNLITLEKTVAKLCKLTSKNVILAELDVKAKRLQLNRRLKKCATLRELES